MMSGDRSRESLSALLDGEAGPSELSAACAAWRSEANTRADWHAYSLIGDTLRSDDLAVSPARDAAFLVALRGRLALEPVVLAPQPLPVAELPAVAAAGGAVTALARPRRRRWAAPFAVAAGFVAVGGVLVAMRSQTPESVGAPVLANVRQSAPVVTSVSLPSVPTEEIVVTVPGDKLIRDARLDRYLDAHNQFAGSSALGGPSGYVRSTNAEAPGR